MSSGRSPASRSVSDAIIPQPMSTPTAAGMMAPVVGITEPMVAPMPTWASGIRARWPVTKGSRLAFAACSMVFFSTSLPHDRTLPIISGMDLLLSAASAPASRRSSGYGLEEIPVLPSAICPSVSSGTGTNRPERWTGNWRAGPGIGPQWWNRRLPKWPLCGRPSPGGSAAGKGQIRGTARRGVVFRSPGRAPANEEECSSWHLWLPGTDNTPVSVLRLAEVSRPHEVLGEAICSPTAAVVTMPRPVPMPSGRAGGIAAEADDAQTPHVTFGPRIRSA